MELYIIFSVDGDWNEYFRSRATIAEKQPNKKTLLGLIESEIKVAGIVGGKFLHFIHSSPVTENFFAGPEFISLWKKIEDRDGSVGVHCHYEELFSDCDLSSENEKTLEKAISSLTTALLGKGLRPISYRGGYLSFCAKNVPMLEKNGLFLDFSCDSGRYLKLGGKLVSDWSGTEDNYYRMSYEDHRKPGKSKIIEIPLGKTEKGSLYIDNTSLFGIWKGVKGLAKRAREEKKDIIVSALSHTYEFASFFKRLKIRMALLICKIYATFINDREALGLVK